MDEPTDEQRECLYAWLRAHPYGEQDENGVDLSLLRENLKRTPRERLERHQRALHGLEALRHAAARH